MSNTDRCGLLARAAVLAALLTSLGTGLAAAEPDDRASMPGWSGILQERTLQEDDAVVFASYVQSTASISKAELDGLPVASGSADWQCLTEALYFEARGESVSGQIAVAEVILNRVDSRKFPNSVCGVVHQGGEERNACQFSYHCDGRKEQYSETKARDRAGKIARIMLDGRPRNLTDGAVYFHTDGVSPRWARRMTQTAEIGTHVFYRAPTRLTSN